MGLQLLLSVPQAEGTGARSGCITSAVALGTSSDSSQANPVPSAQDPMYANAVLETRDMLEGMADGNVKAQKEETLLSPRPGESRAGLCSPGRRGLCCVWCLCSL